MAWTRWVGGCKFRNEEVVDFGLIGGNPNGRRRSNGRARGELRAPRASRMLLRGKTAPRATCGGCAFVRLRTFRRPSPSSAIQEWQGRAPSGSGWSHERSPTASDVPVRCDNRHSHPGPTTPSNRRGPKPPWYPDVHRCYRPTCRWLRARAVSWRSEGGR